RWINQYGLSVSNTTIVGHSLGGALAQYFGATTGFKTLTYNAYGIGNEISGGSNITNYITMYDPVSALPRSKMIGKTYMLQDETLIAALGHGISNFTSESNWVRGYSRVNSPHDIDVIYSGYAEEDERRIYARINGSKDDTIFGGEINNVLIGGGGKDTLYGMGESDTLQGGKGNDILVGGYSDQVDAFTDYLYGGDGKDTYISGDSDHIMDSDGKGSVYFEGKLLTGGTKPAGSGCGTGPDGSDEYYGNAGVYKLSGSTLTFTKDGKILTIENYHKDNKDLSITLKDNEGDGGACPSPTHDCPKPVNPIFNFNFSLPIPIQPVTYNKRTISIYHYSSGSADTYTSTPSTPHTTSTPPAPKVACPNLPNYNSAGKGGGGGGTPPVVLDLNRNGITSISMATSTALFDYDGDNVLENTAWIEGGDALLVNDINNDGIINNASELFGNYTKNSDGSIAKSGYQALSYYDTNSNNVIDVSDTRFEELKLWIDANGDGVTDTGELKTLSEMGVTSLTLNSATPYIPTTENTNTIIQETTFTDANGEGIMRDVLFRYENTSTNTDGVYFDMDGNGIKEKMLTWTDPNEWMVVKDINGDGIINSGREVVGNNMILSNGTKAADTIQALKTFDINNDGKVDSADNSGLAFWTDRNHNGLTDIDELEALGAAGAIQTIKLNPYQTLLSGYDNNKDGVINSSDQVSNYLYIQTNADDSVTLYLPDNAQAKAMIAGYTGGESIQTSQGEKVIKNILFYAGYSMDLNDTLNGTDASETLAGSSRSETLRGMGGGDILDAGAGDDTLEGGADSDKLMGGAGNDTYLYNRGDGKDLIIDSGGSDTISFSAGITRDDLIIKSNGADISIYLKDGTKPLSQLTDQIIIKDWHTTSTVNAIAFSDGTTMDERDIVTLYTQDESATAGEDYVGRPTFDVRIAAGETYATFDISILNDTKKESTETFYTLIDTVRTTHGAHVDFTLTDIQSFTIEDDDSDNGGGNNPNNPNPDPKYVTVSVSDAQAVESAGTISFVVSLSEILSEDVSIDFITQDASAHTGDDYVQYGRYGVTIPAGQRSAVYQVVLLNDEVPEDTENFSLTPYSLSYTGAENVLLSNSATGTIYDDDDPQYVSVHISDASAKERAEHLTFTVSLSKELERDITISTSLGDVTIAAWLSSNLIDYFQFNAKVA
ncbi:MAG: Calx-beta domain-containing protein, partial [Sulfuricurvum sp.]|nr:Calx-beta domain-containing protein [Sulfuricurvum sp.]